MNSDREFNHVEIPSGIVSQHLLKANLNCSGNAAPQDSYVVFNYENFVFENIELRSPKKRAKSMNTSRCNKQNMSSNKNINISRRSQPTYNNYNRSVEKLGSKNVKQNVKKQKDQRTQGKASPGTLNGEILMERPKISTKRTTKPFSNELLNEEIISESKESLDEVVAEKKRRKKSNDVAEVILPQSISTISLVQNHLEKTTGEAKMNKLISNRSSDFHKAAELGGENGKVENNMKKIVYGDDCRDEVVEIKSKKRKHKAGKKKRKISDLEESCRNENDIFQTEPHKEIISAPTESLDEVVTEKKRRKKSKDVAEVILPQSISTISLVQNRLEKTTGEAKMNKLILNRSSDFHKAAELGGENGKVENNISEKKIVYGDNYRDEVVEIKSKKRKHKGDKKKRKISDIEESCRNENDIFQTEPHKEIISAPTESLDEVVTEKKRRKKSKDVAEVILPQSISPISLVQNRLEKTTGEAKMNKLILNRSSDFHKAAELGGENGKVENNISEKKIVYGDNYRDEVVEIKSKKRKHKGDKKKRKISDIEESCRNENDIFQTETHKEIISAPTESLDEVVTEKKRRKKSKDVAEVILPQSISPISLVQNRLEKTTGEAKMNKLILNRSSDFHKAAELGGENGKVENNISEKKIVYGDNYRDEVVEIKSKKRKHKGDKKKRKISDIEESCRNENDIFQTETHKKLEFFQKQYKMIEDQNKRLLESLSSYTSRLKDLQLAENVKKMMQDEVTSINKENKKFQTDNNRNDHSHLEIPTFTVGGNTDILDISNSSEVDNKSPRKNARIDNEGSVEVARNPQNNQSKSEKRAELNKESICLSDFEVKTSLKRLHKTSSKNRDNQGTGKKSKETLQLSKELITTESNSTGFEVKLNKNEKNNGQKTKMSTPKSTKGVKSLENLETKSKKVHERKDLSKEFHPTDSITTDFEVELNKTGKKTKTSTPTSKDVNSLENLETKSKKFHERKDLSKKFHLADSIPNKNEKNNGQKNKMSTPKSTKDVKSLENLEIKSKKVHERKDLSKEFHPTDSITTDFEVELNKNRKKTKTSTPTSRKYVQLLENLETINKKVLERKELSKRSVTTDLSSSDSEVEINQNEKSNGTLTKISTPTSTKVVKSLENLGTESKKVHERKELSKEFVTTDFSSSDSEVETNQNEKSNGALIKISTPTSTKVVKSLENLGTESKKVHERKELSKGSVTTDFSSSDSEVEINQNEKNNGTLTKISTPTSTKVVKSLENLGTESKKVHERKELSKGSVTTDSSSSDSEVEISQKKKTKTIIPQSSKGVTSFENLKTQNKEVLKTEFLSKEFITTDSSSSDSEVQISQKNKNEKNDEEKTQTITPQPTTGVKSFENQDTKTKKVYKRKMRSSTRKFISSDDSSDDEEINENDDDVSDEAGEIINLEDLHVVVAWDVPLVHRIETRMSSVPNAKQMAEFESLGIKFKRGFYNAAEDAIIKKNWLDFCKDHDIRPDPKPFLNLSWTSKSLLRATNKLNFVRYLARGLTDRMLYSVYKRFQTLFAEVSKGNFTEEEDQTILTFYKNSNERYPHSILGKILNRSRESIKYRYLTLIRNDKTIFWTNEQTQDLVSHLLKETGQRNIEDLKHFTITIDHWKSIEKKMGIGVRKLKRRWSVVVYSKLFVEEYTYINEIRRKLIRILRERKIPDRKSIIWKDMAKDFNHLSGAKLYAIFENMCKLYVPKRNRDNFRDVVKILTKALDKLHDKKIQKYEYKDDKIIFEEQKVKTKTKVRKIVP